MFLRVVELLTVPAQDHPDQEQHTTDRLILNTCNQLLVIIFLDSLPVAYLSTSMLSPLMGGPGRERTNMESVLSPAVSSDSMGDSD